MLQTEFSFVLPRGFVDRDGNLHRDGVMRLASAADEIAPLQDPRVQRNAAYMTVILLSRVVTKLGTLPDVNPSIVEKMFAADVSYLQDLYERINGSGDSALDIECPHCRESVRLDSSQVFRENSLGE
jgi:hypothetical protein